MSDSETSAVLFSPEQKKALVRFLELQLFAGLELEDVVNRLHAEEFVEQQPTG